MATPITVRAIDEGLTIVQISGPSGKPTGAPALDQGLALGKMLRERLPGEALGGLLFELVRGESWKAMLEQAEKQVRDER